MAIQHFIQTHKTSMIRFVCVGALSAIVNFASFTVFLKIINLNYQLATTLAYILSVLVHFTLNKTITFKNSQISTTQQIHRYLILLMINYVTTICIVKFMVEVVHVSPYIGIACAIGTTMSSGYFISKSWVFKRI